MHCRVCGIGCGRADSLSLKWYHIHDKRHCAETDLTLSVAKAARCQWSSQTYWKRHRVDCRSSLRDFACASYFLPCLLLSRAVLGCALVFACFANNCAAGTAAAATAAAAAVPRRLQPVRPPPGREDGRGSGRARRGARRRDAGEGRRPLQHVRPAGPARLAGGQGAPCHGRTGRNPLRGGAGGLLQVPGPRQRLHPGGAPGQGPACSLRSAQASRACCWLDCVKSLRFDAGGQPPSGRASPDSRTGFASVRPELWRGRGWGESWHLRCKIVQC